MAETRSITAGFTLPLLQAGASAGIAALAVGAIGQMAELQTWKQAATLGAACAGGGVWFWQLLEWSAHLRAEARWMAGETEPAPTPAYIEPEPAPVEPLKVHITSEDERHTQILDLPTSAEKLAALAAAVLEGATFSEAQWTGSGALFGRAEFQQLRTELIRRGLLAWASPGTPARGVVLTRPGRSAFRYFASLTGSGPTGVK